MDATAEQAPQAPTDSTRTPAELFRYSTWVHVGLGAEECDERETGSCGDPLHFHAWCRLPNQFQHQDIRERALAAKARRLRQLRDPDTDAFAILDADMADLAREGDREALLDELVNKEWWKRQLDAMAVVEEREEFKLIDRDRERLIELQATPEKDRPADELEELERHLTAYGTAVEEERSKTEAPLRDSLEAMSVDELVAQVREDRIGAEASQTFMETYSKWEWFAGTFRGPDPIARSRRFSSIEELQDASPEVIEALRSAYGEMETSLQRGPQGN